MFLSLFFLCNQLFCKIAAYLKFISRYNKREKMKKHFPGFDSLRFFAALLVVLQHIESSKAALGWGDIASNFFRNGHTAVYFFFTLSGFLITYKLLQDKSSTQGIEVSQFYIKRILRIWPLYFFVLAMALIVLPILYKELDYTVSKVYTQNEIILYLLFLPFAVNYFYSGGVLTPLWSIGVEEYFYVLWAPLLKWVKWDKLISVFISIIVLRLLFSTALKFFDIQHKYIDIINVLRFEYMALGGIGAYFYMQKPSLHQSILFKKPMQILLIILLFVILFYNVSIKQFIGYDNWYHFLTAFLFIWLILNVGTNPYNIIKIANPIFEYLGKLSYGMYAFHTLVIAVVIAYYKELFIEEEESRVLILYTAVLGYTIITSILSYHFLEKPFLNYKKYLKNWSADPKAGQLTN